MRDLYEPFAQHAAAVGMCHAAFRAAEMRHVDLADLQHPCLDFGCGDGSLAAAWLAGQVSIGVDLRRSALRAAHQTSCYTAVVQAAGSQLPLADASLGSIVSISVFEHLTQPAKVLAELYRVLRPGGKLVATVTISEIQRHLYWPRKARGIGLPWLGNLYTRLQNKIFGHVCLYDTATWQQMLQSAGFELVECRRIVSPAMVAHWDSSLPSAALGRVFQPQLAAVTPRDNQPALPGWWRPTTWLRTLRRRRLPDTGKAWLKFQPLIVDDSLPGSVLYIVAQKPASAASQSSASAVQ